MAISGTTPRATLTGSGNASVDIAKSVWIAAASVAVVSSRDVVPNTDSKSGAAWLDTLVLPTKAASSLSLSTNASIAVSGEDRVVPNNISKLSAA